METLTSNEIGNHEKIKTHFARIVVGGTAEKPCYGILYYDPSDGKYHQGFGSYVLEYVFNWLAEEFEITGDAFSNEPDRHGVWIAQDNIHINTHYICSACKTDWFIPDGTPEENSLYYCPVCGAKMEGMVIDG